MKAWRIATGGAFGEDNYHLEFAESRQDAIMQAKAKLKPHEYIYSCVLL